MCVREGACVCVLARRHPHLRQYCCSHLNAIAQLGEALFDCCVECTSMFHDIAPREFARMQRAL